MAKSRRRVRSRKKKNKYTKILRAKMIVLVLVAGFLLVGVFYLLRLPAIQISTIQVEGAEKEDKGEVEKVVKESLSGTFFHIVPKENIFLYPKETVLTDIRNTFPRFKTVYIDTKYPNNLVIKVKERQADGVWCQQVEQNNENNRTETLKDDCYYIDSTGYAFSKAPQIVSNSYIPLYGMTFASPLRKQILQSEAYETVTGFVDWLKKENFGPLTLAIDSQEHFTVQLRNGGEIKFTKNLPLTRTIDNLSTLLTKKDNLFNKNTGQSNIGHIDLRFNNKIFYQLKSVKEENN